MRLRTLIKWLAIALLVLVAALAVFLLSFDLNDYRSQLEAKGSELLGRAVTVDGSLRLGLSLYPTLVVEGLRIGNPEWASRPEFLRVERLDVEMALLPLLRREIVVSELAIEGADLLLEKAPDGASNWSFGGDAERGAAPGPGLETPVALPQIQSIAVERSTISYVSPIPEHSYSASIAEATGSVTAYQPLQLSVKGTIRAVPFTLEFTGGSVQELLAAIDPWPVDASASVADASVLAKGTVSNPLEGLDLDLQVRVEGERLDAFNALARKDLPPLGPYGLDGHLLIRENDLQMTDLKLRVGKTEFTGTMGTSLEDPTRHLRVAMSTKLFDYEDFRVGEGTSMTLPSIIVIESLEIPVEMFREMDVEVDLDSEEVLLRGAPIGPGSINVKVNQGLLQMDLLRADVFGGKLRTRFQLDVRGDEPAARLDGSLESVDYGLALEAFDVTEQIRGTTNVELEFSGQGRTIGRLLDQSTLHVRAGPSQVIHHDPKTGDSVVAELRNIALSVAVGDHIKFELDGRFRDRPLAVGLTGGTLRSLYEGRDPWPLRLATRAANASLVAEGHLGPWRDAVTYSLAVGLKGGVITAIDPDPPPFGPYRLTGKLDGGIDRVAATGLEGQLGRTTLTGALELDLAGERPRLQGEVASPFFRLDDFVKPTGTPLPVVAFRAFDLSLAVQAGQALLGPIELADVTATAVLNKGVFTVSPIHARVLDGEDSQAELRGLFELNAAEPRPVMRVEGQVQKLSYGDLLKKLKITDRISGMADLEMSLKGDGMKVDTMLKRASINLEAKRMQMDVRVKKDTEPRRIRFNEAKLVSVKGGPIGLVVAGDIDEAPFSIKSTGGNVKALLEQSGRWPVRLSGDVGKISMDMDGHLNFPLDGENFTFKVGLNSDRLSDLSPVLRASLPDWGPFAVAGAVSETKDGYAVRDMEGHLASSDVRGTLTVGLKGPRPRVVGDLISDKVVVPGFGAKKEESEDGKRRRILGEGRLLKRIDPFTEKSEPEEPDLEEPGPEEPEQSPNALSGDTRVIPEYVFPVDALDAADLDIGWRVKDLDAPPHEVGDLAFRVKLQDGHLILAPVKGTVWGGSVDGSLDFDSGDEVPTIHVTTTIEDLDYGRMLETMEVTQLVTGRADRIHVDLRSRGNTLREALSQADGQVELVDGALVVHNRLIDLWAAGLIRTAMTSAWEQEEVAHVNCVVANFDVKDGIASSDELLLDTERVTIAGIGTIDLGSEEIDVILTPRPKEASLLTLGRPVRVSGPLSKPDVSADKNQLLKSTGWAVLDVAVPILLPVVVPKVTGTTFGSDDENLCEAALAGQPIRAVEKEEEGGFVNWFKGLFKGSGDQEQSVEDGDDSIDDET